MTEPMQVFREGAFWCLAAGLLSLVPACPHACPEIGCASGAFLSIDVADDVPLSEGSTVTACFNDRCDVGTLPAPADVRPGSGAGITFPPGSAASGTVWATDVTAHARVEIQWYFRDGTPLQSGDRYRLTLSDPAGVELATKKATASSYQTTQPNGPDCEPTCHQARFQ